MIETIRRALTRLGEVTAHPAAFALVLIYAGLWFAFDRKTLDWHAFATLGTLFMTSIIQRAENRDTQALHANLDELLRLACFPFGTSCCRMGGLVGSGVLGLDAPKSWRS